MPVKATGAVVKETPEDIIGVVCYKLTGSQKKKKTKEKNCALAHKFFSSKNCPLADSFSVQKLSISCPLADSFSVR